MDEVQQVGHRRPQALDGDGVDAMNGVDHAFGRVATLTGVQQARERTLVVGVLVNVGDAQLGLPQERVVGALENLALFGDGPDHYFERRAAVHVAKAAGVDLAHHGSQPAPNGTEVLQPFVPKKPAAVRAARICFPALDERREGVMWLRHHRCNSTMTVAGAADLLLHFQQ